MTAIPSPQNGVEEPWNNGQRAVRLWVNLKSSFEGVGRSQSRTTELTAVFRARASSITSPTSFFFSSKSIFPAAESLIFITATSSVAIGQDDPSERQVLLTLTAVEVESGVGIASDQMSVLIDMCARLEAPLSRVLIPVCGKVEWCTAGCYPVLIFLSSPLNPPGYLGALLIATEAQQDSRCLLCETSVYLSVFLRKSKWSQISSRNGAVSSTRVHLGSLRLKAGQGRRTIIFDRRSIASPKQEK